MDMKVQSGRRALRQAAAATVQETAVERAAMEVPDGPPVDNRHLFCRYASTATGCSRGEACCFAHGPMGTLTASAYTARRSERTRASHGAVATTAMFLSVMVNRPASGPRPVISALASLTPDVSANTGRRLCFQLVDEVFPQEAVGKQLPREHYRPPPRSGNHRHTERRRASVANNLASRARAIQSAWNLAWEAGSATEDELPDRELIQEMVKGLVGLMTPRRVQGYAA